MPSSTTNRAAFRVSVPLVVTPGKIVVVVRLSQATNLRCPLYRVVAFHLRQLQFHIQVVISYCGSISLCDYHSQQDIRAIPFVRHSPAGDQGDLSPSQDCLRKSLDSISPQDMSN